MSTLFRILISGLIVYFLAWLLPGITIDSYVSAILVALLISVIDITIKPLIELITFPLTLITFGLWLLVVNIILVFFIDFLLPGFHVNGALWALIFALGCSLLGAGVHLGGEDRK